MKPTVFEIDDGEQFWIIATSGEEALRIGREEYQIGEGCLPDEGPQAMRLDRRTKLRVRCVDFCGPITPDKFPKGYKVEFGEYGALDVTATCGAWADFLGVGVMVASTIY